MHITSDNVSKTKVVTKSCHLDYMVFYLSNLVPIQMVDESIMRGLLLVKTLLAMSFRRLDNINVWSFFPCNPINLDLL